MAELTSEAPCILRPLAAGDADAVAVLLGTLGYPAEPTAVAARLAGLAAYGAATFGAEVGGALVGLATAHAFPALHADAPVAQLTALVVAPAARGRGVGRALVRAAEQWASARGAVRLSLASGAERGAAHRFYAGLGYAETGRRLVRALPQGGERASQG